MRLRRRPKIIVRVLWDGEAVHSYCVTVDDELVVQLPVESLPHFVLSSDNVTIEHIRPPSWHGPENGMETERTP